MKRGRRRGKRGGEGREEERKEGGEGRGEEREEGRRGKREEREEGRREKREEGRRGKREEREREGGGKGALYKPYLVKEKSQLSLRLSDPLAQTVGSLPHEERHLLASFRTLIGECSR